MLIKLKRVESEIKLEVVWRGKIHSFFFTDEVSACDFARRVLSGEQEV